MQRPDVAMAPHLTVEGGIARGVGGDIEGPRHPPLLGSDLVGPGLGLVGRDRSLDLSLGSSSEEGLSSPCLWRSFGLEMSEDPFTMQVPPLLSCHPCQVRDAPARARVKQRWEDKAVPGHGGNYTRKD